MRLSLLSTLAAQRTSVGDMILQECRLDCRSWSASQLRLVSSVTQLMLAEGYHITTLQTACPAVLGMVQTYLALAQAELDAAHRKASPVENWRL
jgi:hypothetical protein